VLRGFVNDLDHGATQLAHEEIGMILRRYLPLLIGLSALSVACSSNDKSSSSGSSGGTGTTGSGNGGLGAGGQSGSTTSAVNVGGVGGSTATSGTVKELGPVTVTFTVDPTKGAHAISPNLYCINVGEMAASALKTLIRDNGLKLVRAGGNRYSAYNWENNASNAGSDYLNQNDGYLGATDDPGLAAQGVLETAQSGTNGALITGQLGDYVSADKEPAGDVDADPTDDNFDYLTTRFKKNRVSKGGTLSVTPDATDDFVNQDEFINWVHASYPSARVVVSLDNEPDLWHATHARIWPTRPDYDGVVSRNVEYAKMVREVFPAAEILGLASYGWYGWHTLQGHDDATTKGEFLPYYLKELSLASMAAGTRLIDYVDVHWYPEATAGSTEADRKANRVSGDSTTPEAIAARLSAPRSLWDTTYVEKSWIADSVGAIGLIPLLKKQISEGYPDTKLAFGEWSYGASHHISGGLATADVLGVFGREDVGLACNWFADPKSLYMYGAYQLYGNYDGKGSRFGDTSVSASTTDVVTTSVYAATDASDSSRMTVIAINKSDKPQVAELTVSGTVAYQSAATYLLSAASYDQLKQTAHPLANGSVKASSPSKFKFEIPAMSAILLVPSSDANATATSAWPTPAVVSSVGWTFDSDVQGWELASNYVLDEGQTPTLSWDASVGSPTAGAVKIEVPFSGRKQNVAFRPGTADRTLDLTNKQLTVQVKRSGAFDGGIMVFAMSGPDYTPWVSHGWTMLPSEDWVSITFDPVAIKAKEPTFDPADIREFGIQFATGDAGSTTPGPVTFYVDSVMQVGGK
jgi:hypothetical protein